MEAGIYFSTMRQRVNWRPVLRRKSWHGLQACLISRLNTSLGLTESGTRTGLHNISALKSVSRSTTTVIFRQVRTIFTRSLWKENTLYYFFVFEDAHATTMERTQFVDFTHTFYETAAYMAVGRQPSQEFFSFYSKVLFVSMRWHITVFSTKPHFLSDFLLPSRLSHSTFGWAS